MGTAYISEPKMMLTATHVAVIAAKYFANYHTTRFSWTLYFAKYHSSEKG